MKSSKFSIIQVLAVIDCSILLKSHYIIQLLRYVIHAMRKLFEVKTMAAILIFTTHAIDACGISYQTGFNCVVHGNLCVDGAVVALYTSSKILHLQLYSLQKVLKSCPHVQQCLKNFSGSFIITKMVVMATVFYPGF